MAKSILANRLGRVVRTAAILKFPCHHKSK
jgi:hypothetical protein